MSSNHQTLPEEKESKIQSKKRWPYNKPVLKEFGDVRSLTLGASPGITDSNGQGAAFPGGRPQPNRPSKPPTE